MRGRNRHKCTPLAIVTVQAVVSQLFVSIQSIASGQACLCINYICKCLKSTSSTPKPPEGFTMDLTYDEDDKCPICHCLLHNPVSTECGHTTCNVCLVMWITHSMAQPQHIDASFTIQKENMINGLDLKCPLCRAETRALPDSRRRSLLQAKYTVAYEQFSLETAARTVQDVFIQMGNKHKNVPPSISPLSGMTRTHYWVFFLTSSRPDIIQSVDLILHSSYQNHRFVTLQKHPFTKSSLSWGYFEITALYA